MLDSCIGKVTANETLGIKDCVLRIGSQLILGSITNQSFIVSSESNIGRSNTVTLIIRNDFNTSILEHTNTAKESNNNVLTIDLLMSYN